MKKVIFIAMAILVAIACTHDKNIYTEPQERIAYCEAFENYEVPVKAGYTTIVTEGDDTLAVVNEPTTIKIPKGSILPSRGESGIKVDFAILNNVDTYSQYWQAVMFEDTEYGDYDYNDLVIHVKNVLGNGGKEWDLHNIYIQPIALGGGKTIKLGCILPDNSEHIITEDVRTDLFHGAKGFINTVNDNTPIRYKLMPQITNYKLAKGTKKSIAWFIEVDGKRYYAVTSDYHYQRYDMLNHEGMPYGLVVGKDDGTFKYPQEKISIFKAYPDFSDWVNGRASWIGTPQTNMTSKFCNNTIPGKDGRLYKIWDYQDLE